MKKQGVIIIACSLLFKNIECQKVEQLYTIDKAQQCFHSQVLPQCQEKIQQCLKNVQCEQQLMLYQDCTFQKEFDNQIFNGNCFKNWKKSAVNTEDVIGCIDQICNLAGYNSDVSLSILYSCSTEALVEYPTQCDESCQQALKRQISSKIPYQPVKKIYQQNQKLKTQLNNQNASKIAQIISKECIDQNGSIRKRHQSNLLQKKMAKQKMQDHIKNIKQNLNIQQKINQPQKAEQL